MKIFYLFGVLLLGVLCKANEEDLQDITKHSDEEADAETLRKIMEKLQRECLENGGEHAMENLMKAFENTKTCVEGHVPSNPDELKQHQESSDELCSDKRKQVQECFTGMIGALENCSKPEEKYFPHFLLDAIEAVLDYICADEEAFFNKIFGSFECIATVSKYKNATDPCKHELQFLKLEKAEDDVHVTKEQLCQDLLNTQTCYGDLVEKECPGSPLKDLVVDIYGAVGTACDKRHKRNLPLSFRF